MNLAEVLAVFAAGAGAAAINAVVGSGTLITFPVLLAIGLPPVTANVTNTVGLVAGSITGTIGYRRELSGQTNRILRYGLFSVAGGLTGGLLLLWLPASAFKVVVPVLIALGCILVVIQPWLSRRVARPHPRRGYGSVPLNAGIYACGIYGGYFGAAQGVLLIGLLGVFLTDSLQRINGIKNVLAGLVNFTAALLFVFVADVRWDAAALIALGALIGGQLGATFGRRLPDRALRAVIVAVGLIAIWKLVFS